MKLLFSKRRYFRTVGAELRIAIYSVGTSRSLNSPQLRELDSKARRWVSLGKKLLHDDFRVLFQGPFSLKIAYVVVWRLVQE